MKIINKNHTKQKKQQNKIVNGWFYEGVELFERPGSFTCFVYKITLPNGLYYYGKKDIVDGKNKETNWLKYYSSSDYIKKYIKSKGVDGIKREIIKLFDNKFHCRFGEEYILFTEKALFDKNCLNANIGGRYYRSMLNDMEI